MLGHTVCRWVLHAVRKNYLPFRMKNGAVIPPYSGHVMRLAVCTYYAMREGPNAAVMKDIFESK